MTEHEEMAEQIADRLAVRLGPPPLLHGATRSYPPSPRPAYPAKWLCCPPCWTFAGANGAG